MSDTKALAQLFRERNELVARILEARGASPHSNRRRTMLFLKKDALDREIRKLTTPVEAKHVPQKPANATTQTPAS